MCRTCSEYLWWKEKVRSAPPVSGTLLTRHQAACWLIPAFQNTGRAAVIPVSLMLARWTPYVCTVISELFSSISFLCPFSIWGPMTPRNLIQEGTMNKMSIFQSNTKKTYMWPFILFSCPIAVTYQIIIKSFKLCLKNEYPCFLRIVVKTD